MTIIFIKSSLADPDVFHFAAQEEIVATDFSLLVGLSVALVVFLVITLSSIKFLRSKGRSPSVYTMTNLSKYTELMEVNTIN